MGVTLRVAEPDPLLSLDGVTLRYGSGASAVTAVQDITVDLAVGDRLVLLGPSGCGKSSLLRAVGGFQPVDGGRIHLRGKPVGKPGPDRMAVFQEFDQLLPWRTVLGNVRYALQRGRGLDRATAGKRARDWIGRVGLTRVLDAYPHTLSGGMKQRVAIARAFALEPDLLLMDEPFAALDALTRRQMQDELLALCEQTGASVLFVTHGIDEAIRVGTHVLSLSPHPGRMKALIPVPLAARQRGTTAFAQLEASLQADLLGEADQDTAPPSGERRHG
ncbi:ABC transporter ATP-binding protein [Nitrospirillum iridis]|uniref:NitT/TauT family transport system ATP-binding protein n=1 Tax=Nitrospirillum iridis TaxID=765888 RepID=A0A7X0AXP7_9PROT|nr:ABC transporter ATP-binding protein [Nitrospirillum iridis]MBB6252048.1 NitT/TauT family transport system ATP-binding protein [Nitrospirillum iridis]